MRMGVSTNNHRGNYFGIQVHWLVLGTGSEVCAHMIGPLWKYKMHWCRWLRMRGIEKVG